MSLWENNEEIQIFREYLKIPSVHPNVDYDPCVKFLQTQARNLELPIAIHYPANEKNPVVVLTWIGSQPDLSAVMLNSHMDVVPVFEEFWTHPPFSADIDEDGKIFARGSQDMKSVGSQYLAAVRAFKRDGIRQLKRTIHVVFMPDEETGSVFGMQAFAQSDAFKAMHVGFSMDESSASPTETFGVFYAERSSWKVYLKCKGQSGHGSLLLKDTAADKILYLLNKFMEFRRNEIQKLENNPELELGNVTTVNLTMLEGGIQGNVIPPELTAIIDVRIAIDVDHQLFEQQIKRWCKEAGENVDVQFQQKDPKDPVTNTDNSNSFWLAFKEAMDDMKLKIKTCVCPGATDARFIRKLNIPALGFSAINNTPVLLHDHDEFVYAETYLAGIQIYKKIISKIGNV